MPGDRQPINAPDAPAAVGPYAQAVRTGDLLFCSGQIPIDPRTGELVGGTVADQAGRCLENLAPAAFAQINEVYESFFESDPPARVAIGVAALPRGAKVEIDAVVAIPD